MTTATTSITAEQLSAIVNAAVVAALQAMESAETPREEKPAKPRKESVRGSNARKAIDKPKTTRKNHAVKPRIEVQSNIKGAATRAINKAKKAHNVAFALETLESYCVTKKGECKWAWLRCTDGKLNHENGEAIAASMGDEWEYSPRRNAIVRKYDHDIRKNH